MVLSQVQLCTVYFCNMNYLAYFHILWEWHYHVTPIFLRVTSLVTHVYALWFRGETTRTLPALEMKLNLLARRGWNTLQERERVGSFRNSESLFFYFFYFNIQPLGRSGQRPEFSQATGMALVRCILGKFLGVACHCFPPHLILPP